MLKPAFPAKSDLPPTFGGGDSFVTKNKGRLPKITFGVLFSFAAKSLICCQKLDLLQVSAYLAANHWHTLWPDGNNGDHRRASKRRNGDTAANTEQDSQTRQVGELDRRRSAVDGLEQMDRRLRNRRNDTEGKGDEREIHSNDKTNDASIEPGGGVSRDQSAEQ